MTEDSEHSYVTGVVTGDPTKELPVGSRLQFQSLRVRGDVPEGCAPLNNWEFFEGVLLQLSFTTQTIHRVDGSGVLVAPGIALCATHVVAPYLNELIASDCTCTCFGITSDSLQIWNVRKITSVPSTDVTILGLELISQLPRDNTFNQSVITTRTPSVGEELTICGFVAGDREYPRSKDGGEVSGNVHISKGSIVDVYPLGRDRSMMPWPALAISVLSRGGMSGGPVYDKNGLLVGLLCSSIDYEDDGGLSNVSLLWPALSPRFEGVWPAGLYTAPQSLLELSPELCVIDKRDAIYVKYDNCGNTRTQSQVW